jgi:hypothetical protein
MQSVEHHERSRLSEQNLIQNIRNLDGTFWVKEIPDVVDTDMFSYDTGFVFFDDNVVIISIRTTVLIPELPITSVQRYDYSLYKFTRSIKSKVIDDNHLELLDGLISFYLNETFLYVSFKGEKGYERYSLHSVFDTETKWPLTN